MMMKKYLVLILMSCLCICSCKKEDPNKVYKTAVQENVVYKMFPTTNMWNFIKLDTRNGKMWQVQYSIKDEDGYRGEAILNDKSLLPNGNGSNGRFTLIPTQNMYNFILLDQQSGKTWQVQWSFEEDHRLVIPITE